ncbi:MAG: SMC family ATPase [bacterium]
MRLKSLSLKNYRQYKDSTVEFGDGLTGVIGLNGAGKSTLMEAIAWTLYGPNAARTGKEGIKRATAPLTSSVETQLIMDIGGTEYKIVRVLKGSSQTADASIFAAGRLIADSVKGVEKEVSYLLGMDWKSFYTSFFARQKELNALTDLTPASRRDTIIRMLRIDAVDKVVDAVKKQIKDKKLELDLLKKKVVIKAPTELLAEKMVIERNIEKLEKSLKVVGTEINKLEATIAKFKAKFDEERAISNKYFEFEKKRTGLEGRLTGLSKRESELNDQIVEARKLDKEFAKIEKAYKEYSDLEKQQKKLAIARESEIQSGERKLEELRDKFKELGKNKKLLKAGQPCPTCGQLIKDGRIIEEHIDEEMEKIKAEGETVKAMLKALKEEKKASIKELKFDFEEYTRISKRLAELEEDHERYQEVKAKLNEKNRADVMLARVTQERKDLEAELKKVLADTKELPYDAKKHEQITEEFDAANTALSREYNGRNDLRLEIERLATQVKEKQREIDEAEETKKSIDKLTLNQEEQERFINLVTDYRQFLISRIRPKLSEISGSLLAELTAGKYTGVELDEEYNLFIYDGNAKYPLPRFSGGEADIANLCLRLAISQLIAGSSGTETGFIILDEIFGSQDIHRKSLIIQALNNLSRKFRQIILITHVEDIKDTVENIIEIAENEEGVSYIKA